MLKAPLAILFSALLGGTAFAQPAQPQAAQAPANVVNPQFATPASGENAGHNPDPWEGLNRTLFGIFQKLDPVLLRPPAVFYKHATPRPIRTGLRNAFSNLREPVIFINDMVQFHFIDAGTTLGRLSLNSTVGLAGLFDPATAVGLPFHENGFGTTMGRYGAPPGPYIFIPVLGPSDVRDVIGNGLDALSDPLTWIRFTGRWELNAGRVVISGLDQRANADAQLKQINSMATDPYATIRSLYLQNRKAQISGGQINVDSLPSFGDEPEAAPNQATIPGSPNTNGGPVQGEAAALPDRTAPTTTAAPATDPNAQSAPQDTRPPASSPH